MTWISVKDRLPALGEDVLLCGIDDGEWVFAMGDRSESYDGLYYLNEWNVRDCNVSFKEFTHWMPLPAPPKEIV